MILKKKFSLKGNSDSKNKIKRQEKKTYRKTVNYRQRVRVKGSSNSKINKKTKLIIKKKL